MAVPAAALVAMLLPRHMSDADKLRMNKMANFFARALRAAPTGVTELLEIKTEDVYSGWSNDDLLEFKSAPVRADLLETIHELYRSHPALRPIANVNALEVDHIWEVQLFTRAIRDIEMMQPNSFSIAQIIFLSDSIINDTTNLTVTFGSINRAKGGVMKSFLAEYGRDAEGLGCSFDSLLVSKPTPVLRASNFPPSLHFDGEAPPPDPNKNYIRDKFYKAMCVLRLLSQTFKKSTITFPYPLPLNALSLSGRRSWLR